MYRIGIDVGGTFTDFLLIDEAGNTSIYKVLSTPEDPSIGVINGIQEMADEKKITIIDFIRQVNIIVHGTTVTTNAILTERGAKTGLITTKGFRDVLAMRRGIKEEMYNNKYVAPKPLVRRYLTRGVGERTKVDGAIIADLNKEELLEAITLFKKEKVEAIAVCFMNSFANPKNEIEAGELIEKEMPDKYLTLSCNLLPQIRLYDRISTTVMNSYVGPIIDKYLDNLQHKLVDLGFDGALLIMQSNGGVMSPEVARKMAASTLLSGPAGGPVAGMFYSDILKFDSSVTVDMGGTSFDATLVVKRLPMVITDGQINRLRLALPMLGMNTIGAGGGSIAWIDEAGLLRVGPQSAGANPGPACYGFGGSKPTVTDANLVLGYLNRGFFLGGKMKLDQGKAEKAIEEGVAKPLGLDTIKAACGIYNIINVNMAAGIREITIKRGVDPREFPLIVAGGAGPIHSGMIASELEMPVIIVPKQSSIFCAAGMLMSDLKHDYVRTYQVFFSDVDKERLRKTFEEMKGEGIVTLETERISKENIEYVYTLDIRYTGQVNEVNVQTEENEVEEGLMEAIASKFHQRHEELYGYCTEDVPLELINLRLTCIGKTEKIQFKEMDFQGRDCSELIKKKREIYLEDKNDFSEVEVYDGEKMGYGHSLKGPALIEQITTTVLVLPGWNLTCDKYGNYVIYVKSKEEEMQKRIFS